MKGFGKRRKALAGCVLLICLLAVTVSAAPAESCSGGCTHQAAVGTTHYDTLAKAITAAKSGSTVTLLTDVTTAAPLSIDKPLALDLSGKTVTASLSAPQQAAVTFLAGGAVRNGKIIASNGSALLVSGSTVAVEKDAVLEGSDTAPILRITAGKDKTTQVNLSGTVTGKATAPAVSAVSADGSCELYILKESSLSSEDVGIFFDCAGKLSIEDGMIETKLDTVSVVIDAQRKTELAISGGKLISREGEVITITAEENAAVPRDFVTGGTYETVPTAYTPSYANLRENADGTYTVISTYALTFLPGSGTGIMDPVTLPCGSSVQLPLCSFTPPGNMDFSGWEIGGTVYAPDDTYTPANDVTVTALWKAHQHTGGNATCLKQAVCTACGKAYGDLAGHTLTYTGGYAATCSESGMNTHSRCDICGNLFVGSISISASALTIPALGHQWELIDGKPATCEEDGLKTYRKCKTCAALLLEGKSVTEEDLVIPAAGHSMEAVAALQATCTEAGLQAHEHCTVCDQRFLNGKTVDIAALTTATASHVLSDWQNDEYYHWKSCVDCGEVFRQSLHHDADGDDACDDCGHVLPVTEAAATEKSGFSLLFLIPIIAAVAIAAALVIKKQKA